MWPPHSGQNLVPTLTMVPHCAHFVFAMASAPHSLQNLPLILPPHLGQVPAASPSRSMFLVMSTLCSLSWIWLMVSSFWATASSCWMSGAHPLHRPLVAFQQFSGQTHLPQRLHC